MAQCIERVGAPPPRDEPVIAAEPQEPSSQKTVEFLALMVEEADAT